MSDNIKQVRVAGSGVEYTKQKILQTKKKVITKAQLYKIPHNSGKLDLSLRLGRYNIFENTVESDKPRSELTLDNIELEELISYLESDYRPLSIGKGDYLKIENSSVLSILQHIESLKLKSEEVATLLLNSGMLNQDVQFFIEILRKRKSLEEFEKEIQLNKNEQFWQQWFLQNKWVLGSEYLKIIDERKINTENIADYIMLSVDGFVDLVEIKRPGVSNFWQDKKDHANLIPSSDLIKAIVQCANYIEILENEANSINTRSRLGGAAISKPNCMLVFGRSNNWGEEEYKAFRLLNSTINKINIISYDMLLLRAKNLMGVNYIGENDE